MRLRNRLGITAWVLCSAASFTFALVPFASGAGQSSLLPNRTTAAPAKTLEREIGARGLATDITQPAPSNLKPPTGTEVDETIQTSKDSGQPISRTQSWDEPLDTLNELHLEVTAFPSHQWQVAFWVLPNASVGCAMFGRTMYDQRGRALKSEFWRNDSGLKITGGAEFPTDLYPEAVPAIALPRSLNRMKLGGAGRINQQITPYGYIDLMVTVNDAEPLNVPAGRFSAVRVKSQPNVATILPSWPHFILDIVSPFVPKTTYYFDANPPYRFLRKDQEGTPMIGGPEATTQLVRYYVEGTTASASAR